MEEAIKVIQYGVGAMGSNMVKLLSKKPGVKIVGAIDIDGSKIGRDLGEVAGLDTRLGVEVQYPPEKVFESVQADVVLHATTAFLDNAFPQIMQALDWKINVVTITQELFFPLADNLLMAEELDRRAKQRGVRLTATGINPGFIMDILPIVSSLPCWEIKKIFVRRVVDFSPYGPDEMKHIGAGLDQDDFIRGAREGIIGHIGLLETAAMVDRCLGLGVDELVQTKEPILARRPRKTKFTCIDRGKVCGFKQNVIGFRKGAEVLVFRMIGILSPDLEEDGVELGDYARIDGIPNVDISIKEEISQKGGLGTAAVAVNMIPCLLAASPGYHTMNSLTLPHIWNNPLNDRPPMKISYYLDNVTIE
jgi:4-hydroxy-tetrahydrodipicolinate reductase